MSSALLHCTICPKRPNFSDISHLLTHVSSKGHLSHLHKLQVRSHQEIEAGQQLAIYNTWYQHNGIGQLLSERLLQKQAKKVQARSRNFPTAIHRRRRLSTVSTSTIDPGLAPGWGAEGTQAAFGHSFNGIHSRTNSLATSREQSTSVSIKSDESDYESSPVRRHRKHRGSRTTLTLSLQPPQSPDEEFWTEDETAELDEDDVEQSKLKGIYWPGMSIFDSASDEMKKKRNQKKDGSLLKQMKKTSEIVEPQEVIYSPQGSLAKIRVITGMVEDSSPLKGESPIPKKRLPKPKRPALAPLSGNIPYRSKRTAKPTSPNSNPVKQQDQNWRSLPRYEQVSSRRGSVRQTSGYMPTEDENREFKLTVGNLKPRSSSVQVFKDTRDDHQFQPRLFPCSTDGIQDYRMPALSYGSGNAPGPRMNGGNTPLWLRPPHSQPTLPSHLFSPERTFSPKATMSPFYDNGIGKENVDPFMQHDHHSTRQSLFEWDGLPSVSEVPRFRSAANNTQTPSIAQNIGSTRPDCSGYGINPLSFAFQKLQEPADSFQDEGDSQQTGLQSGEFVSPNGTLSDPAADLPYQF